MSARDHINEVWCIVIQDDTYSTEYSEHVRFDHIDLKIYIELIKKQLKPKKTIVNEITLSYSVSATLIVLWDQRLLLDPC